MTRAESRRRHREWMRAYRRNRGIRRCDQCGGVFARKQRVHRACRGLVPLARILEPVVLARRVAYQGA